MINNTINDAVTIAGGEGTLLANRYRIVRQLGRGGMGNVWLVEDTQLDNKPFAVKMLPSILVANKRAYRQLKDEALVAMRLVHPNIVQIRAFEGNDGNPFLVMDYIDGQTLDDYLAEHTRTTGVSPVEHGSTGTTGVSPVAGCLSEAEVLRILRPIAAALDYAHSEGVVHRDVKPANVMIRKDGHPFILDFGIAREIQETMTRMTGKFSSGTLLYMSPEQLNGALPKPAQDVYSFSAMVYECLKGEPPFVRGQIEYQILNNPPPPLVGRGVLDAPFAASVMVGLAKKPEDRPTTCVAVLDGNVFSHKEHKERKDLEGSSLPRPSTGASRMSRSDNPQPGRARSPSGSHGHADEAQLPATNGKVRDGGEGKISRKKVVVVIGLGVAFLVACAGGAWWWTWEKYTWEAERAKAEAERAKAEAERTRAEWKQRERRGAGVADKGHTKVQLWEGGPYWADTNIGAERPWEAGYYFWWGDTVGYKRDGITWVASKGSSFGFDFSFEEGNTPTFRKDMASLKSDGWITTDGVLAPEHDAAHVYWRGEWRMPTKKELQDLIDKCDWTWATMNGVNGYVVRGRGDYASVSIFLPCAGRGSGTSFFYAGSLGYYWSSVPDSGYIDDAWFLGFNSGGHGKLSSLRRYGGQSVRPVQGFTK